MIDGITVLSKEMVTKLPGWVGTSIIIIIVLGILGIGFAEGYDFAGVFTVIIFFAIIIIFMYGITHEKPTGKYEYQVLIDDSANFNKIYDRYEIVGVKGKVYTIRDKEIKDD